MYEQLCHYKEMAEKMETLYANCCWGGAHPMPVQPVTAAVQQQQQQAAGAASGTFCDLFSIIKNVSFSISH